MTNELATPMRRIAQIEVRGRFAIFHTLPIVKGMTVPARHVMRLEADPDRDDHFFELPVYVDADRASLEGPYLRLYTNGNGVAEFTLKDTTA